MNNYSMVGIVNEFSLAMILIGFYSGTFTVKIHSILW